MASSACTLRSTHLHLLLRSAAPVLIEITYFDVVGQARGHFHAPIVPIPFDRTRKENRVNYDRCDGARTQIWHVFKTSARLGMIYYTFYFTMFTSFSVLNHTSNFVVTIVHPVLVNPKAQSRVSRTHEKAARARARVVECLSRTTVNRRVPAKTRYERTAMTLVAAPGNERST